MFNSLWKSSIFVLANLLLILQSIKKQQYIVFVKEKFFENWFIVKFKFFNYKKIVQKSSLNFV